MQPLAFSKEMLPVGSRTDIHGERRPKAVSEFLVERMLLAGADRICFVISPDKTDILSYYAHHPEAPRLCYMVQDQPRGLCDAIFRAAPLVKPGEDVLVGLPDTVWFPVDGFNRLPAGQLSFLLFWVEHPELFDAVVIRSNAEVGEIQVKSPQAASQWVWGAFRMAAETFSDLHLLWQEPGRRDQYAGTLINAYLARGGHAWGITAGESYCDVGTLDGYRMAVARLVGEDLQLTASA